MKNSEEMKNPEKNEAFYGLPQEVIFCKKCVMPNQRPNSRNEYAHSSGNKVKTLHFDEEGVCSACRHKEKQHNDIDWEAREKELIELCNKFRKNDGSYDCIVPGSGGKDSVYAAWLLKYKYGMNPLTVTWAPHLYTDVGWKNFENWLHVGGFDNFLFTPNGKTHRLLTRLATINLFHPFQPFIMGQKTFVQKMCAKFNIPLAFYGEMPGEYGNTTKKGIAEEKTFKDAGAGFEMTNPADPKKLYFGGVLGQELIDKYGVNENDLLAYTPPDPQEVKDVQIHYLGYYVKWDPQEAYYFAVEKTNFEANDRRTCGTYSKYNSIDDKTDPYFYWTTLIKFGYGRATQDASQEIRNKKITREEGIALVKKYDLEFPARYLKEFLEYIGMTKEELLALADKFRSPHLWKKENGEWELRHPIWNESKEEK